MQLNLEATAVIPTDQSYHLHYIIRVRMNICVYCIFKCESNDLNIFAQREATVPVCTSLRINEL
jgi:hypothetical protein